MTSRPPMDHAVHQALKNWRFTDFRNRRRRELCNAGLPNHLAAEWAARETRARARASLFHGIDQALNAKLLVRPMPGDAEPTYLLMQAV